MRTSARCPGSKSPFGLSGFRTCLTPFEANRGEVSEDIQSEHRQRHQKHRDPASVRRDDRSEDEDRDRGKAPILLPEFRRDDSEGAQAVHQDGELKREAEGQHEEEDETDEVVREEEQKVRAQRRLIREQEAEGEGQDDGEAEEDPREEQEEDRDRDPEEQASLGRLERRSDELPNFVCGEGGGDKQGEEERRFELDHHPVPRSAERERHGLPAYLRGNEESLQPKEELVRDRSLPGAQG